MLTEIKRPEVGPNADELTSLTRGRGPRRGNLEDLLKYWRPIMKKPGGFRRCVVILMDKPQFGGKPQRICAWLHHEITGKWPNEGKGKRGRGRGGKRRSRSVRRVRSAARRAKSDVLTPETFEISPLSLVIRESRDFGGVLVQPIAGRQSAVELKAAMFSTYSNRVAVVSGNVDEKRVGVVGSNTAIGQAAQAAGSIILPGDISDFRSPIRSQIYETLTPGGGRGLPSARRLVGGLARRGRGGTRGARNKFRCPPGYQKGGTFTNAQFSTCGAQILGIPGKGVGSPSSGAQRALAALARDASLVREIGDLRSNRNPYDIIRAAQIPVAPKKGSPTRRQTSINNVLSRADEDDFSLRAVRRDGVILEPVVSLQALGKLDEFDDLADGTLVDTYKNGQIGKDLVPAFSTGLRDVYVSFPETGAVKISRVGGELSPTEIDSLRRSFPTSLRRAADLPDPSAAIRDYADRSDGRLTVEFGELKNNRFDVAESKNKLIRVQTAGGKTLTVPQWVYDTFLSRSAPRRAKDAPVYEISSEEKTINPFLIARKSVPLSVVSLSSKQAEIDFRAMYFSQMLDSGDVKAKRPRKPKGGRSRAIFDSNLNRYRCPPGTRYGGRISDKFGRNCGYSLPRQLVNSLVDFGVRMEDRLDKRKRRRRGVDTQPGDRGGVNTQVRGELNDIFQRLDNIEKELGLAFDKVEDRRPGRVGATIGERRARQDLTDREKELLEGNDLAEAIEGLGRVIDGAGFDDASDEELREAFRRVEKVANLEAGRLTETPPRSPEQRNMAQRILDAISRAISRLADRLGGRDRDRGRGRDRDRDVAPAPRGRDGGARPRGRGRDRDAGDRARAPRDPDGRGRDRDDSVFAGLFKRPKDMTDAELLRAYRTEDRGRAIGRGDVRPQRERFAEIEAELRRRGIDPLNPGDRDRDAPDAGLNPPENILDRLQQRAEEFDKRFGGRTGDFIQDLNDSELDDFINAVEENADDLGEEGRDMLGRLRFERNRRRRDDNGVLSVLNDMQAQQEDFDKRFGGKTLRWVEQVGDEDLDRFIDALERADAGLIGEEGAQMLRNLITERDRRNRPPKSGDDILREIDQRAEAFDLKFGGMTADFVNDLDDLELNRFIDGLRRFDAGDEGREMLERLENERALRRAAPAPHRRRVEDVNIGRRAVNRNRRQNIEEFDDLTPANRSNLAHQAGVEFDELAEEWRVVLGADDINSFSEADMRDFVARKIKNNDSDARLWRRRYNDYLELNELNRRLGAAQNDEDIDTALNDHVGRLAAARRDSIVNARGAVAADRPNRNDGREDRGGAVPPPNNVDNLVAEINEVERAGNVNMYEDAELNDRLDMLNAEYNRYGGNGDLDGPPPRRLAQARDALRRERERRNAQAPNDGREDRDGAAPSPNTVDGLVAEVLRVDGEGNMAQYSDEELNDNLAAINAAIGGGPPSRRQAAVQNALRRERQRRGIDQAGDPVPRQPDGDRIDQAVEVARLDGNLREVDENDLQNALNRIDQDPAELSPDKRRAAQRIRREILRRDKARRFQDDRPLAERDTEAVQRHLDDLNRLDAALEPDQVDGLRPQINELQAELDRRVGVRNAVDAGVADVPSANPSAIRSVFDLANNRRRRIRRRQDKMDELAQKFWGDERPFELGRTGREAREKWATMPSEERDEYIRKMYLHGKEVDLDTFEHKGKVYRKSFEMNVNTISYQNGGLPRGVSGQATLRIRDEDGNVVKEATYVGYPDGGFSRSFSSNTVNHDSFGLRGAGMFFTDDDNERVNVEFNTGGGGAEQFNSNAFAFYKGLGYSKVRVGSAAGDGKAAWAVGGFRAPNREIERLNQPNGSVNKLMLDYDAYKSAVAAGNLPNAQQIHARMVVGDDTRRERVEILFNAARNAESPSGMPDHADYAEALKPSSGRNTAFYNFLRPTGAVGRGMDDNDRDDLIRDINREIGSTAIDTQWFKDNDFNIQPQISGGTLSLAKLKLPSNRRRRNERGADTPRPNVPAPDSPSPAPRANLQTPYGTPLTAGLGSADRPGVPNKVSVGNVGVVAGREIAMTDQTKADEFVNLGGSLGDVPDDFLLKSIKNNTGQGSRFISLDGSPLVRNVNDTGFFRDTNTGAILGYKYGNGFAYFQNEGANELWGAEVAQRFGFHQGNMRYAGLQGTDADRDVLPNDQRFRANYAAQPIVFEAHQNFFGQNIGEAATRNDPRGNEAWANANEGDRARMLMLDAVLLQPDRHGQNWMVAEGPDGGQILPIDHGAHMEPGAFARGPDRALALGGDTPENAVEAIRGYLRGDYERNYDNRRVDDLGQDRMVEIIRDWQKNAQARENAAEDLRETIAEIHNRAPGGVYDRAEVDKYVDRVVSRFNVFLSNDPETIAGWFFERRAGFDNDAL